MWYFLAGSVIPWHSSLPQAHYACDIHQRERREQVIDILLQATVTNLGKTKLALQHMERMFHLGPHLRFGSVFLFVFFGQGCVAISSGNRTCTEKPARQF